MKGKIVKYRYTISGLPNVWILCRRVIDDEGKKTYIIPDVKGLHRQITHHVINSDGVLTGAEIRFLRMEMGMTQAEFGELVDRGRLTVAKWERGAVAPGLAMDMLIRMLASNKLKVDTIDPEKISGKHKIAATPKKAIRIDRTKSENSRLAA